MPAFPLPYQQMVWPLASIYAALGGPWHSICVPAIAKALEDLKESEEKFEENFEQFILF